MDWGKTPAQLRPHRVGGRATGGCRSSKNDIAYRLCVKIFLEYLYSEAILGRRTNDLPNKKLVGNRAVGGGRNYRPAAVAKSHGETRNGRNNPKHVGPYNRAFTTSRTTTNVKTRLLSLTPFTHHRAASTSAYSPPKAIYEQYFGRQAKTMAGASLVPGSFIDIHRHQTGLLAR